MNVNRVGPADIHIILVTTDCDYAGRVQSTLAMARHRFVVEQILPDEILAVDLETRLSAARERAPTLVILDFDGMKTGCDLLAPAIGCVISRAAFDAAVVQRLRDLDALFLAEGGNTPKAARWGPRPSRRLSNPRMN